MLKKALNILGVSILAALAACGPSSQADAAGKAAATAPKTGAAASPTGSKWLDTVTATPEGGFAIGNPNAPIKLIEFASLTCPHCANFQETGSAELKNNYVATGKVQYEFRNFVLNGADAAFSIIIRCEGAKRFFPLLDVVYARQKDWIDGFAKMTPEQQKQLEATPQDRQLLTIAQFGGLDTWVKQVGISKAKADSCLADPAKAKQLTDIRQQATEKYQIQGTPSFVINGSLMDGAPTWPTLKAKLDELAS